jgi:hypothetical protein
MEYFLFILFSADWRQKTVRSWEQKEPQDGRSLGPESPRGGRLFTNQEHGYIRRNEHLWGGLLVTAFVIILVH